jgi:hypothetical protein
VNAEVRHFLSPDLDVSDPAAEIAENSSFLLQAIVGPAGGEGAESLELEVCTLDRLRERVQAERLVWGHPLVVVEPMRLPVLLDLVRRRIERVSGTSWPDVARRLAKLGAYEFDD